MPLPLTVSCFSKIQIGFTFLVPAHLRIPGKGAVKRVFFVFLLPTRSTTTNGFVANRQTTGLSLLCLCGILFLSVAMSTIEHRCSREAAFSMHDYCCLLPSSHCPTRLYKTVLSCCVGRCELGIIYISICDDGSTVQIISNIYFRFIPFRCSLWPVTLFNGSGPDLVCGFLITYEWS